MGTEPLVLQKDGDSNFKLPKEESLQLWNYSSFDRLIHRPSGKLKRYSRWSGLNFNRLRPYDACALYTRTTDLCGCCVGSQCFQVRAVGRTGRYSRLLSVLPSVQLKKRTASDLNLLWSRTTNNRRSRGAVSQTSKCSSQCIVGKSWVRIKDRSYLSSSLWNSSRPLHGSDGTLDRPPSLSSTKSPVNSSKSSWLSTSIKCPVFPK